MKWIFSFRNQLKLQNNHNFESSGYEKKSWCASCYYYLISPYLSLSLSLSLNLFLSFSLSLFFFRCVSLSFFSSVFLTFSIFLFSTSVHSLCALLFHSPSFSILFSYLHHFLFISLLQIYQNRSLRLQFSFNCVLSYSLSFLFFLSHTMIIYSIWFTE